MEELRISLHLGISNQPKWKKRVLIWMLNSHPRPYHENKVYINSQ